MPAQRGVERGDLSPFRYFGIADDVDYTPIPWSGGRFDPEALTEAVETQERAQHTLDVWREQGVVAPSRSASPSGTPTSWPDS